MAIYNSIAKTSNIVNMFSILLIVIVQGFSPCGTTNPAHSSANTEVAQEKPTSTPVMSFSDLMFGYKKLQEENREKDEKLINIGIECAFIEGRQTCEAVFKLVKTFENELRSKSSMARLKNDVLNNIDSPTSKSLYVVPENLSNMQLHSPHAIRTLKAIKVDYFIHWKPYADHLQKTIASNLDWEEKELIRRLSQNKLSLYEFGWSMSKAWIVFCGYVHCDGAKSMREYRKFDTTPTLLELIKTHNNWIMTKKDLLMLNIAAKIINRKPILKCKVIDKKKQLAVPVSMDRGKIGKNCPALITKNRQ